MYKYYNPNPSGRKVDDCVIRTISKLFNISWDEAYDEICDLGAVIHNMPSSNEVWGEYLRVHGFERRVLSSNCPYCMTISEFCDYHKTGIYALATGSHVVAAVDGTYYDSGDSGDEVVAYYWIYKGR